MEVAVVCCESLKVLCYGRYNPEVANRCYLLYTGQHYDPIVSGENAETLPADERRLFLTGDKSLEADALRLAQEHNEAAERRAKERRVKRIKCGGCGAILNDSAAFQSHCMEVEHSDDFAYDCSEVEVVVEDDANDTSLRLDSENVHTFYLTEKEPLSLAYPAAVSIGGNTFRTVEHYWHAAPYIYIGCDDALIARVKAAATPGEALIAANGAGINSSRPDWSDVREPLLLEVLTAKYTQHKELVGPLMATGEKTIVCVDADPWLGMQAPGGVATGANNIGKALEIVRQHLREANV